MRTLRRGPVYRAARPRSPEGGSRPAGALWTALALATLAAGGCGGGAAEGEPVLFTVPRGASLHQVVDTLEARGVVERPTLFRLFARLQGAATEIRAGRYAVRQGEGWNDLLEVLTRGRVVTVRLTVPEGFTLRRMAPTIASLTGLEAEAVHAHLTGDTLHQRWNVPGPGLEGYLFPDTYLLTPGVALETVVETMVERYRRFWTPARTARLDSLEMTEREVVTLASIIQAEARHMEEMPVISAVYHNRLRIGYPLQADPTVLYALGGPRERLLYAAIDSVADDPYNTYTQPGLPPGPIGAPGEAALEAALRPADADFLYFVARPDGTHVFTRSLTEHNRAKARARREWDALPDDPDPGADTPPQPPPGAPPSS